MALPIINVNINNTLYGPPENGKLIYKYSAFQNLKKLNSLNPERKKNFFNITLLLNNWNKQTQAIGIFLIIYLNIINLKYRIALFVNYAIKLKKEK